jgi:hypothetical protein
MEFNKAEYLKKQSEKMKNGTGSLNTPKTQGEKIPAFNMLIKSEGEIYDIGIWKGKFEGGYYFYLPDDVILTKKSKLNLQKQVEGEIEFEQKDDIPF